MGTSMKGRHRGFTLPELLITLSIASLLVSMAVPSFQGFRGNQLARGASQQLFASLMYARTEAIKRNTTVTVSAVGGDWGAGWTITSGGSTLRTSEAMAGLSLDDGAGSDPVSSVSFNRQGRLQGGGTPQIGFCTRYGSAAISQRLVRVDLSGRASIALGADCP